MIGLLIYWLNQWFIGLNVGLINNIYFIIIIKYYFHMLKNRVQQITNIGIKRSNCCPIFHTQEERDAFYQIFFQNNTHFQIILLVNIISKLFRKLTSRVYQIRVHCSNSSIKDSISMKIYVELEFQRLEFHKRKPRNQKM